MLRFILSISEHHQNNAFQNKEEEICAEKAAMETIRTKVVELADKNANPSFLNDVQSKAEELFTEFNETARRYSAEYEQLKQINLLSEKVRF